MQTEIAAVKRDLEGFVERFKLSSKGEVDELRVFIHTLIGEIESLEKMSKKQKGDLILEIDSLNRRTVELDHSNVDIRLSMGNMGEMITCLVENS
jgi:hypothetical protein